ncbi:MAG: hypothetical protein ACK4EY_15160 [Flavipsychrobacter sp.]
MKSKLLILFSFLMFCLFAASVSDALQSDYGIHPAVTIIGLLAVAFSAAISRQKKVPDPNLHLNAVEVTRWVDYIVKRFWKDNGFLMNSFNDDQYVVGGKTVVIPQPGSKPSSVKNPTSFPLTATQRTDTDISYDLDLYATLPTHITNAEAQEVSYDKMDSVMGDHVGVIDERASEELLIKWITLLPEANIIRTTGGPTGLTSTAKVLGQTGNRYLFHHLDLKRAQTVLNLQNVLKVDRNIVLESNQLDELTSTFSESMTNAFNQYYNAQTGQIGKLYGFNIFERSSTAIAADALNGSNQLVVDAYGASVGSTDQVVNIGWQKNSVARAMGEKDFYEDKKNPLYLGDIYNASIRFGGRRRYANAEGVIAIVQETAL